MLFASPFTSQLFQYGRLYGGLEQFQLTNSGHLSFNDFINELNERADCSLSLDGNSLGELCEIFNKTIDTFIYNNICYVIVGGTEECQLDGIVYLDKKVVKIVEDEELIEKILKKNQSLYQVRFWETDFEEFHEYQDKWQWETSEQAKEAFDDALKKGDSSATKVVITFTDDYRLRKYNVVLERVLVK